MNVKVLSEEVQEFIHSYNGELTKLAFRGSPFPNITTAQLLQQIEGRRRIQFKLPEYYNTAMIYYPPGVNLEQASSSVTAKFKSELIKGKKMADATGGFGIDSYFFSKVVDEIHYFELNQDLKSIAEHNFNILGASNIICYAENGVEGIAKTSYDAIYADPSRRDSSNRRVYYLEDCEPNVIENLELLLEHCKTLLIKTSPMLDITAGMASLKFVDRLIVLAVENDVKELLWLVSKDCRPDVKVETVNLGKKEERFGFSWNERNMISDVSLPMKYLYEPNAAIMKSGGFGSLSKKYDLTKLHQSTHLFSSDELIEFPGRRFEIKNVVPYTRADLRTGINFDKANVATRNFPMSVEALRKKWKIADGGEHYVFFTTGCDDKKMMLICAKI